MTANKEQIDLGEVVQEIFLRTDIDFVKRGAESSYEALQGVESSRGHPIFKHISGVIQQAKEVYVGGWYIGNQEMIESGRKDLFAIGKPIAYNYAQKVGDTEFIQQAELKFQ